MKDLSKITNVLLFKDGFYWLTMIIAVYLPQIELTDKISYVRGYTIIPDDWELKNGFEFASDAYSYIAHLQEKEEV